MTAPATSSQQCDSVTDYLENTSVVPLFLVGNSLEVLHDFPSECVDCCMTSPPYWGHRDYASPGIGLESDLDQYIWNLVGVLDEVKRVLKPTGSLWLNLGDSYQDKRQMGVPWRVALHLIDRYGWTLRNDVIWHKVKGAPDTTNDRLRNIHEFLFHLVKQPSSYYYNVDAIRSSARQAKVVNGAVVSATGVTGIRYRRQIELSTALNVSEKQAALKALDEMLKQVVAGEVSDFRMIIRGQQRATHSASESVSGRARELRDRGFYFLKYHPNGAKPSDVWEIVPEDTQNRAGHFAPYPPDLCRIPILATCPPGGIVLDPFCGTGTTMLVAMNLERKSIGIDLSPEYVQSATERCRRLL